MSAKSVWQFLFLLALFGGIPVVSWYYLQSGLDYRLAALSELGNMGAAAKVSRQSYDSLHFTPVDLNGKVHLGIWIPDGNPLSGAPLKHLQELHEQFALRNDVAFYLFTHTQKPDAFLGWLSSQKLHPSPILYAFSDTGVQQAYYFYKPDLGAIPVALVDTSGVVRKHYNLASGKELTRLTEHLAMLLPVEPTRNELIFKRDKEK